VIYDIIGEPSNFIRIRGYTDNQKINNEIFASNWELSVFRATAILQILQSMGVNPARMAIEGYGQYYPSTDNLTPEGRAKNRKVVIAVSKYGLEQIKPMAADSIDLKGVKKIAPAKVSSDENIVQSKDIQVIRLNSGNIRITTRKDKDK
jgi:chemotaxis protein MotB